MLFGNNSRRDLTPLQKSLNHDLRTQSAVADEGGYGLEFEPVVAEEAMRFAARTGGAFQAPVGVERHA